MGRVCGRTEQRIGGIPSRLGLCERPQLQRRHCQKCLQAQLADRRPALLSRAAFYSGSFAWNPGGSRVAPPPLQASVSPVPPRNGPAHAVVPAVEDHHKTSKQGCLKAIRAESLEVNERLQPIKLATSACSDSSSRVRLQHWEAWDGDWGGGAALQLQLAVITQRSTGRSPSFYKTSVFMDLPASRTSDPQPAASRIILHLTARSIHNM